MSMDFRKKTVDLIGLIGVEDAESLLEWLRSHPDCKVDLSECTHLNAANLQVLMAAKPPIAAWPADEALSAWLRTAVYSK